MTTNHEGEIQVATTRRAPCPISMGPRFAAAMSERPAPDTISSPQPMIAQLQPIATAPTRASPGMTKKTKSCSAARRKPHRLCRTTTERHPRGIYRRVSPLSQGVTARESIHKVCSQIAGRQNGNPARPQATDNRWHAGVLRAHSTAGRSRNRTAWMADNESHSWHGHPLDFPYISCARSDGLRPAVAMRIPAGERPRKSGPRSIPNSLDGGSGDNRLKA